MSEFYCWFFKNKFNANFYIFQKIRELLKFRIGNFNFTKFIRILQNISYRGSFRVDIWRAAKFARYIVLARTLNPVISHSKQNWPITYLTDLNSQLIIHIIEIEN